jgi:hypothetical protein
MLLRRARSQAALRRLDRAKQEPPGRGCAAAAKAVPSAHLDPDPSRSPGGKGLDKAARRALLSLVTSSQLYLRRGHPVF